MTLTWLSLSFFVWLYQRNRTVYNEHICEPRFIHSFWSFCFSLFLSTFLTPPWLAFHSFPPPPTSHNYFQTISTSLPHTLNFTLFNSLLLSLHFLLFSCVDPPLTPLCRIITMSPWGLMNALCICPTRGADEEATIASSQKRWCLQTGLEPLTSTSTSQTGSPPLPSPTWTARMLQL